jgi:YihY family inner membrane protein
MKTATYVPVTERRAAIGVREALSGQSPWELAKDSFLRYRYSDGFSFARSMAFQMVLALIPGMIFVVGLAVRVGEGRLRTLLREAITSLAPGPAGQTFLIAFEQGSEAGRGNDVAIILGGGAAVLGAVSAIAQLQRGGSRIYGVLGDRSTVRRYGLATALTLTFGLLLTGAFLLIALGPTVGGAFQDNVIESWVWARWPLGTVVLAVALTAMFKLAPNRSQPPISWLMPGLGVAAAGCLLVSAGLSAYLNASVAFGETYGPLAGVLGVMLWSFLASIAIFYGLAVSAQLEALSAGVTDPVTEPERP